MLKEPHGQGGKVTYNPDFSILLKLSQKKIQLTRPHGSVGLLRFKYFGSDSSAVVTYDLGHGARTRDWIYFQGAFKPFNIEGYDYVSIESYDDRRNFRGTAMKSYVGKGYGATASQTFDVTGGSLRLVAPGDFVSKSKNGDLFTHSFVDEKGQPCAFEYMERIDLFLTRKGTTYRLGEGSFAATSQSNFAAFSVGNFGNENLYIMRGTTVLKGMKTPKATVLAVHPSGDVIIASSIGDSHLWDFRLIRNGIEHDLKINTLQIPEQTQIVKGSVEWKEPNEFSLLGFHDGVKKFRVRFHE